MTNTRNAVVTFSKFAPKIMAQLMQDFPLDLDDAAAILGNLGHECNGFTAMQEMKPLVEGSRGGWGWAQWTGPRRREFEAYCKRNKLDAASYKANYAFLFLELKGSEKRAIAAVRAADGLEAKVEAFEGAYLRAGIKHYESRKSWADFALKVYNERPVVASQTPPGAGRLATLPAVIASANKMVAAGKAAVPAGGGTGLFAWAAQKLGWLQGWTIDDFANLMLGLGIAGAVLGPAWVAFKTYKAPANVQPDTDE